MSSASLVESQAMDADTFRTASRAGSISTLWSSAEVPFCLDSRVQPLSDSLDFHTSRGHSIVGSLSCSSMRSSQISMDSARLSIDIPEEYPRRPDTVRLTPPHIPGSSSSSGSSPSRVPSFNIGTIQEDTPMQSPSPISKFSYQPPSLGAQHRMLASRFSEDTIDEPQMPYSASQSTFGARLSVPRKSSCISDMSGTASSHSSSMLDTTSLPSPQDRTQDAAAHASANLYRSAYRFFDQEYTVQPASSPSSTDTRILNEQQRFDPSLFTGNASELSHGDSLPSCSLSQASTQATSSDSASAWSAESSLSRPHANGPVMVTAQSQRIPPFLTPASASALLHGETPLAPREQRGGSTDKSDRLGIPSTPSFPSLSSTFTLTRMEHARELHRRPSTADVYSQAYQVSPHTVDNLPLPPLPVPLPTEPVRYEVCSYTMATSPSSPSTTRLTSTSNAEVTQHSTTSRLLRSRVASTPKLRLDASSLFPSEQALHTQPPTPALPSRFGKLGADRRPSTAQMDGRAPFFGRRFRSRTLGESDRTESAIAKAGVTASRGVPPPESAQRVLFASTGTPANATHRHPSQASATGSDLHSPLYPMQPTPGSSICSASSPATTNSSLPVTPRTTTSFSRPKSRGTGSATKTGSAGWASYLNAGLTLHLEQDGRVCQVNMTYLAYDPFGRPEQLVEDTEAGRALTPKRPKSRGEKDLEAEQSGTLEFAPANGTVAGVCSSDVSRKSESSALLKHLTVGDDTKADLLTRQAALSLKVIGDHQVSGYERKGRLAWKFAYRVEQDAMHPNRQVLIPLRFSCSATLLNPDRARKSRLLNLVKKQMVPILASKAVAASSVESPRTANRDDGMSRTTTASPASSRLSNKQLPTDSLDPSSPVRRTNGTAAAGGPSNYTSPLRQPSRTAVSANSVTSADSSFCSQPTTPGRDNRVAETLEGRLHLLQASPGSAQFGQTGRGPRQVRSTSSVNAALAPALQLDLGNVAATAAGHASRRLQEKASMTSLSTSTTSSSSVQPAKPMVINGRKLIPISLPAGLARSGRIDPALLQANVVTSSTQQQQPPQHGMIQARLGSPASFSDVAARQRSISMHSSASSSDRSQRRAAKKETDGLNCLLSSQPRSGRNTSDSSRPPTASETIKLEYLARTAGELSPSASTGSAPFQHQQLLRHQKSFAGAVLTPSSFTDGRRQARRQRSKTNDDGGQRPFTADEWGESQYPSREQISNVRAFSQQHRPGLGTREASFGSHSDSVDSSGRSGKIVPREVLGSFGSTVHLGEEKNYKVLPTPPRPQSRPRTAQTITGSTAAEDVASQHHSRYHIASNRAAHVVRS